MIAFDCPNCDNHLRVGDELAGREGWCRQCKSILVVPQATGVPARILEGNEKYSAVERLFRAAASKAESYRSRAEYAELALARYEGLESRLSELTLQYQALESDLSAMKEHAGDSGGTEAVLNAHVEAFAGLETRVASLATAVDGLTVQAGGVEERVRDARDEGRAFDERLQRLENLLNELMSRVEKVEAQLEPAPKEREDKPAVEISLLKKDLATEHAARLRIEGILKSTAGKIAELESSRIPVPMQPEVPRIPIDAIEDSANAELDAGVGAEAEGGGDPGQDAVLGAFLRFMEQTPRGEFPRGEFPAD